MLKVGITGGIGSGKTTVCRVFQIHGINVYNADMCSKHLIQTNPDLIVAVKKEFGEEIYSSDNILDRARLSGLVFEDKTALTKLNSIVHPVVRKDFNSWCQLHNMDKYILLESAIIFETKLYQHLDLTITIYSPEEVRIQRIMERDGFSRGKILSIIKNQLPDDKKMELSDLVILSDEKHSIIEQVDRLHSDLISEKYQQKR